MKVKCVFCNEISDKKDWKIEHEVCELCGVHEWKICPKCGDSDELAYVEVKEE